MNDTGWTWREIMETPYDELRRFLIYRAVAHVKQHGGELDF